MRYLLPALLSCALLAALPSSAATVEVRVTNVAGAKGKVNVAVTTVQ